MELIKNVIKYLLENPFYAAIVVGCGIAIIAVIVALFIKSAQAKKTAIIPSETSKAITKTPEEETQTSTQPKALETDEALESNSTESVSAEEVVLKENTSLPDAIPPEIETEESILEESPVLEEESNPSTISTQETEQDKPATTSQPISKPKPKKSTRYNGKWLIWRLLIKTSDNDTATEESYFFELVASNGEKLLSSEEYTSFAGAQKGIQTHKANILKNNFRICLTKKGDYIFKLLSGKNTLLCTGENYPTKIRCEKALESTKRFAETAIVDENVHDLVIQLPPEDSEEIVMEHDNSYTGKWIISSILAPDGDQIFYFELFASNGEKLLSSEEYTSYNGVINGINTHKNNIERNNFKISLTKRGDYIFKILNANDQLLCLGEHYKTRRRCENAVESVKRFAKTASIMDSPTVKNPTQI